MSNKEPEGLVKHLASDYPILWILWTTLKLSTFNNFQLFQLSTFNFQLQLVIFNCVLLILCSWTCTVSQLHVMGHTATLASLPHDRTAAPVAGSSTMSYTSLPWRKSNAWMPPAAAETFWRHNVWFGCSSKCQPQNHESGPGPGPRLQTPDQGPWSIMIPCTNQTMCIAFWIWISMPIGQSSLFFRANGKL